MFNTKKLPARKSVSSILIASFLLTALVSLGAPLQTDAACYQLQTYPPQTVCTDDSGNTSSTGGTVSTSPNGTTDSSSGTTSGCYQLQTYPPQTVCPGNTPGSVPGSPATPPGATTPALAPVAFWKFDETSGTTAYDSSGNGYNGVLENGATRYTGTQQGNKLDLDGVDDRVRVETSPSSHPSNEFSSLTDPLNNMNSFTVMAWIRPTENGGIIMRKGNTSIGRFNFGLRADGVLYLRAGYSERMGSWQTTTSLPLNAWSHVAVTYTYGVGNKPTIYLNGIAQALRPSVANPGTYDSTDPLGTPVADTPYLYIGHSFDFVNRAMEGSDGAFEGRMDNVRVYNTILSAGAVLAAKSPEPEAVPYTPFPPVQLPDGTWVQPMSAPTNAVPTASVQASCPTINRTLMRGTRGTDVTQLQTFLIAQNYLAAGNATGFFGALTESAVKQFQCKESIVCSGDAASTGWGAVGPRTRAGILRMCQ